MKKEVLNIKKHFAMFEFQNIYSKENNCRERSQMFQIVTQDDGKFSNRNENRY